MKRRHWDRWLGIPLTAVVGVFLKRRPAVSSGTTQKILLIKLAAVGDTVILIPVIRALRKAMPEARIDWLVSKTNVGLAKTVPYVDTCHLWAGYSPAFMAGMIATLRREKYDAVIDFEQWARGTALIAFLTGAPVRLGFSTPGEHRGKLFTDTVKKEFHRHEIDDFFALASKLTPVEVDRRLELWETESGRNELRDLVSPVRSGRNERKVLVHPGCGADGRPREWPLERYALLANWLMNRHQARIFISGGPDERKKCAQLHRLLNGRAVNTGGTMSWEGTISLVGAMDLVISGNTGVMHVAAALGKPQVALHGPTNPELWGPLNDQAKVIASPCPLCPTLRLGFEYHRKDSSCMEQIDLEAVKNAVSALIDNRGEI